jgi:hypothetical protein
VNGKNTKKVKFLLFWYFSFGVAHDFGPKSVARQMPIGIAFGNSSQAKRTELTDGGAVGVTEGKL